MALEGLVLTPPTGSPIDLNGSKWSLQDLDLGMATRREDLVSSTDADGGVPARVSMRDTREVTATIRLKDATTKDSALASIAALEAVLESAEGLAADGPTDPVAGLVRLVYTPAGATSSFSLLVLRGEIEVVKAMTGDDAGWFIGFPVVTVKCQCDPFAYGALRTYLNTTTSAEIAPSVTVAGGPGDVPPWTRLAIKDVAATSRGRVVVGVKRAESSTTATILASAMTAVAGTYSAPNLTTSAFTSWAVSGQTARQTRTGNFRIYAHRASSSATGSLRLAWAEAGGSLRRATGVPVSTLGDYYLGEVSADSPWDMWIEATGTTSFYALILEPVDSHIEVTQAAPGEQMAGAVVASDPLQTTSTHIGGRSLTVGGTWTTVNSSSPTWPVSSSDWAKRTATSMGSPAFAQAGTGNHMEVEVAADLRFDAAVFGSTSRVGIYARYKDTSNYLFFGLNYSGSVSPRFEVVAVVAGVATTLWSNDSNVGSYTTTSRHIPVRLQITSDGRFACFAQVIFTASGAVQQTYGGFGVSPLLVSGGTLGDSSAAKAGLHDYESGTTLTDRRWSNFAIRSLTGVTPPPVPSGSTLRLAGPRMYNTDLAEYPYIGSSGITLTPGVNNNLTVIAQRSAAGHASTATADTPALDLDIDGYPRFTSVPHT